VAVLDKVASISVSDAALRSTRTLEPQLVMRLLYTTSDRSFWELARLTLNGEGIKTAESSSWFPLSTASLVLPQREYRLYVGDGDDFTRAAQVLLKLGVTPSEPDRLPRGRFVAIACLLFGLTIAVIVFLWW
jgi:hypothetical protein